MFLSLEHCPEIINGNFDCCENKLDTLKGCPEVINGDLYIHDNYLVSLEHGPKEVDGGYYCYYNGCTSLHGLCYSKAIISDFSDEEVREYLTINYPEMVI